MEENVEEGESPKAGFLSEMAAAAAAVIFCWKSRKMLKDVFKVFFLDKLGKGIF